MHVLSIQRNSADIGRRVESIGKQNRCKLENAKIIYVTQIH